MHVLKHEVLNTKLNPYIVNISITFLPQ